jgi:hypothetical protein
MYSANIYERQTIEDQFYSFFKANDFGIEEGAWVEVTADEHTMFGGLFFSEKRAFYYIITEQEN